MNWWRAHHGMVTDPRMRIVARGAGAQPGQVFAVWMALHEHASAAKPRGDVANFEPDIIAEAFGWESHLITSIIDALTARRMIIDDKLAEWDDRQGAKFDRTNAERQRKYRNRKKQQAKAAEEPQAADNDALSNGVTGSYVTDNAKPVTGNAHRVEEIRSISDTLQQVPNLSLKNIPLRTARAQALDRKEIWDALQACGIPAHIAARSFNRTKINAWLDASATGHQLAEAIQRACRKRQRDADHHPINIGLVDCMIQDVLAGRAEPTNPTRTNDDGDELSRQFAGG